MKLHIIQPSQMLYIMKFLNGIIPCFVFISAVTLFGIDILYILTHPKFYDAEHVIFFLCLSSAGFRIAQMTSIGIAISKKTKYESYANLIGAAISIVLNIISHT